jgi:isopenicillin N synthase-like dioxygenase
VIDAVWQAAADFFAQDAAAKQHVAPPYQGYPYGYLGPDKEALARSKGVETPPDLKESLNGGPLIIPPGVSADAMTFCYQPTLWPDLPGFRAAWEAYYTPLEARITLLREGADDALRTHISVAFVTRLKLEAARREED